MDRAPMHCPGQCSLRSAQLGPAAVTYLPCTARLSVPRPCERAVHCTPGRHIPVTSSSIQQAYQLDRSCCRGSLSCCLSSSPPQACKRKPSVHLSIPSPEAPLQLHSRDGMHCMCALDLLGAGFADAQMPHLALLHKLLLTAACMTGVRAHDAADYHMSDGLLQ